MIHRVQKSFTTDSDVDAFIFVAPGKAALLSVAKICLSLVHRDFILCDLALLDRHVSFTLVTTP